MNEYLDFIKFALDEISKVDEIEIINISKYYGIIFCLNFEVSFKKLGSETFQIPYAVGNGDKYTPIYEKVNEEIMRKQIKNQVKDFKNSELINCEEKIEFYLKKLEKLKKWRENE